MNKGTGVLATIGATAPFVGLFGTVWGIMNSFIGSAQLSQREVRIHGPVDPEGRCGHDCRDAPQPGVSPRTRRRWAASRVHSSHGRCT